MESKFFNFPTLSKFFGRLPFVSALVFPLLVAKTFAAQYHAAKESEKGEGSASAQ